MDGLSGGLPVAHVGAGEEPTTWLLLAVRFADTGQAPDGIATAAANDGAKRIAEVEPSAVRDAIERIILGRWLGEGLQWLRDTGLLREVLPELDATVDFSQEAGRRHKDVWEHTKQVVRQSVPRRHVRWGALLHDIGKVPTRAFGADGKVTFHRHAEVGARMFEPIARRLGFPADDRRRIKFLIRHHLRANQYDATWTDSAVRRFDREMGDGLMDLLDLSRADVTSRRPGRRQEALQNISRLAGRIRALRDEDAKRPPLPTGLGDALMEALGLPPCRLLGELKRALEAEVEAGTLAAGQTSSFYVEHVRSTGLADRLGEGHPELVAGQRTKAGA